MLGDACLREFSCLMVSLDALVLLNDIYTAFGLLQVLFQFGSTAMQVASTVMSDFVSVTLQILVIFTRFLGNIQILTMICSIGLHLKSPLGSLGNISMTSTAKERRSGCPQCSILDCKLYRNDIWIHLATLL